MKLNVGLGALAAIGLVAGFATQAFLLVMFGAGPVTDAFVAAQAAPVVAFSILGAALMNAWQPLLAVATDEEKRSAPASALGQAVLLFALLTLALELTAHIWTPYLWYGFDSETLRLTVQLTRLLSLSLFFNGCLAIVASIARVEGRFAVAEGVPTIASIAALGLLLPAIRLAGVEGAAGVLVLRAAMPCFVLWWLIGCPVPSFRSSPLKALAVKRAKPILAGSTLYKLAPLFDRFLASQAEPGSMTLFNLAQNGASAVATVVDRAVGTPLAPGLARRWAGCDRAAFRSSYRRGMAITWAPVAVLAVILIAIQPGWAAILGATMKLNAEQASLLYAMCFVLLGMAGATACSAVAVTAFYALGDTRTPMLVGLAGFIVSLGIKYVFFAQAGLLGLAWATAIYYLLNMLCHWLLLERRVARVA